MMWSIRGNSCTDNVLELSRVDRPQGISGGIDRSRNDSFRNNREGAMCDAGIGSWVDVVRGHGSSF